MSFFWDPRARRPQIWIYPLFFILAIGMLVAIYLYGKGKADAQDEKARLKQEELK